MKKLILIALHCFIISIAFANIPEEEGKSLFTARCANCHKVNDVFVGPALAGIHERREMDWIVKFVRSSQSMVKAGDKEAVALFEKFKVPMPDQTDLSADDVKNIVAFIKVEASASTGAAKAPFAKPVEQRAAFLPISFAENKGFIILLLLAITVLIASLLFWAKVKRYEGSKVW